MTDYSGRSRRRFIAEMSALAAGAMTGGWRLNDILPDDYLFKLSLSQWSFHRAIFGESRSNYEWFIRTLHSEPDRVLQGPMDPRDIAVRAREEFDLDAVDYVNVLFFGHAKDTSYLRDMKKRGDDHGVKGLLIMCDELGRIGAADADERQQAVEAHFPWMDAAVELSCASVRVNAYGSGSYLNQLHHCAESLNRLAEYAAPRGLDVLVENHGGLSNNGAWLAMLIEETNHPAVGVMADFDNFFLSDWGETPERRYDRYQGMAELAPLARSISSKAHAFDERGQEATIDFLRIMQIILDAGYRDWVSIEYEGDSVSESEGIAASKRLLESVRTELTPAYR